MTEFDLEAIRARDAADYPAAEVLRKLAGVAGNGDPEMQATIDMIADRRALLAAYDALAAAAQAVVDRWDTPLWKDAEHPAEVINRLRRVLEGKQ